MADQASSGTQAPEVKEPGAQGVAQSATNPPAASTAPAPVAQDQPPAAKQDTQAKAPAAVDVTQSAEFKQALEKHRRELQSQKDREVAQVRAQLDQLHRQQAEAEQRAMRMRYEQMDGEEFKEHFLAEQERQTAMTQAQRQADAQANANILQRGLSRVPDDKRAELEQRVYAGEFPTIDDFQAEVDRIRDEDARAKWQKEAESLAERRAREAREAAQKDATAAMAETVIPETASGLPVNLDAEKGLTPDERFARRWQRSLERQKKGG